MSVFGPGTVPGLNELAKRDKQMRQVVNRAEAGRQAGAAGSFCSQAPHPRAALHSSQSDAGASDARPRGIKVLISDGTINV